MDGKRRLMAVLEADVFGYSKLVAEDEVKTAAAMKDRGRIFEHYADQHGGRVVNQAGDSILAVFDSAMGAMESAIAIQRDFENRNPAESKDWPMHFRIGIDLGDVYVEDDQPTSNVVNTAARLEALADPGGICVSGAVYAQIHNKVNLQFEDLGDQTLKNIPTPVRAFRASVYSVSGANGIATPGTDSGPESYIPKIGKKPTDLDWNRFMQHTFGVIRNLFQRNLGKLKTQGDGVETDFQPVHDRMFISKVYVGGVQEAQAKIWLGSMMGSGEEIYYSNHDVGRDNDSSWNESISPARDRDSLALSAMGHHFGPVSQDIDLQNLSPEEAAGYLWRLFVQHLE